MKKLIILNTAALLSLTSQQATTLKGTWEFQGGIYNGKSEGAPSGYTLQRKYNNAHFTAFSIEKGSKPEKYQTGDYTLQGDSCMETETATTLPSKLTGITVHYAYIIRNDTLILKGKLPTGMVVEEYWKKTK